MINTLKVFSDHHIPLISAITITIITIIITILLITSHDEEVISRKVLPPHSCLSPPPQLPRGHSNHQTLPSLDDDYDCHDDYDYDGNDDNQIMTKSVLF